ncbi:hypothetical protein CGCS363_v005629 [Colletotrichum siamense]|uniref:uncharacterized protein n=1 Tax=Colletotrichum siamense TaxID=690259 RepID=UPI0018723BE0|nr:uncharacterized protein CGCS363_v005629 [Colletotrichum siamense]KAF5505309.1 hypothetical protein CGCS363_v005629 [Colletotrichum siamense]
MDIELLEYSGSLAATDLMTASCNPIWPSELNPQKYPEQQSGYLGVAISDSSESPAAIEFVMHDPMASERAKQRTKTTKSEPKTPSNEQSNEHWDMLKETHLRRLYMEEGHTVNEVLFEMLVIHGHELGKPTLERNFRLWGFSKNRSKRKDLQNSVGRRRRIAYALPATASTIKHLKFASMNEARRRLDRQRPHFGLATTYVQQEKMFHAVDHLVKGLFASGKRSWKAVNPRIY